MNFHALFSILMQHTNSPRVGLDSHFSGGSVSFRDYTPLVKINMYAPAKDSNYQTKYILPIYRGCLYGATASQPWGTQAGPVWARSCLCYYFLLKFTLCIYIGKERAQL
jgi:hypothetical protein